MHHVHVTLTESEQKQIAEILSRRANEIASFSYEYQKGDHFGSVEMALTREVCRLRSLVDKVCPPDLDE